MRASRVLFALAVPIGVGKSVPLNRSYPRQDYPKEDFFTGAVMLLFGARF